MKAGSAQGEEDAKNHEQRVSAFPVIDEDDKVIGVVSATDLLSKEAFAGTVSRTLETLKRPRLRSEVNAVTAADLILDTFLCDLDRFTVTVKDGIVTVAGTPETSQVGYDIIDAVRHMEGVVFVRNRLSYPLGSPHLPRKVA